MVNSLRNALGDDYAINYPRLASDETRSDFSWPQQMGELINNSQGPLIIVAHSLGASLLLKYLSERTAPKTLLALFLIAPPFWSGEEDWKQRLILNNDFADKLPGRLPVFLYHNFDDEVVPPEQFDRYVQQLPQATVRQNRQGGHQFNNDLTMVARDIRHLMAANQG